MIIGNLEIADYDFAEKMYWKEAKKTCAALGGGWRLPTKDELNILFENKNTIGCFSIQMNIRKLIDEGYAPLQAVAIANAEAAKFKKR